MTRLASAILLLASCATPPPRPHQAGVLFCITTDCPIANSFAPEITRIVDDYRARGVSFQMVYTDGTQSMETVMRHASDYGYKSLVRIDTGRVLSRQHGITVTPEAVVIDEDGSRVYRGRIDDRYLAPGQYRLKPTTRELRD